MAYKHATLLSAAGSIIVRVPDCFMVCLRSASVENHFWAAANSFAVRLLAAVLTIVIRVYGMEHVCLLSISRHDRVDTMDSQSST